MAALSTFFESLVLLDQEWNLASRAICEHSTHFCYVCNIGRKRVERMQYITQGGIKYYFLSLWYESTWDWTLVSRTIGKHSLIRQPSLA